MLISFGYFDKCDTKFDHLVLTSFRFSSIHNAILHLLLYFVLSDLYLGFPIALTAIFEGRHWFKYQLHNGIMYTETRK